MSKKNENCNCQLDEQGYLLPEEDVCQSCKDWHNNHAGWNFIYDEFVDEDL